MTQVRGQGEGSSLAASQIRDKYMKPAIGFFSLAALWWSFSAIAQQAVDDVQGGSGAIDEVVVTGFRGSLASALEEKRATIGVVDVIKAEDLAKFPDANLAESLQRVP